MKIQSMICALILGACVVQAQLPVEPAVTAPKNSAAQPLAMDWSAGFSSVTPGQLSQRGNASYGAELLHAMAELARAFDAQDAAATAAARERVLALVKEHPEQLNDVAVSADGKWLFTPLTIAFYMQDTDLTERLVEAGALPYLPAHTVVGGHFCSVHTSPHAKQDYRYYIRFHMNEFFSPLELYLQARAAGLGIRTDGFVPPEPEPMKEPCYPRRLPFTDMAHYGPAKNRNFDCALEYLYIPGDLARRNPHEAYHSELIKSYILLSHAHNCPLEHECFTAPEMQARLIYELQVHPEQVDDVFEYWGECNQSPFNLVQLCMGMQESFDMDTLERLFSRGALPFTPSSHMLGCANAATARVMQERSKFLPPLETALQAQALGVNPRSGVQMRRREDFITGSLRGTFVKLPQGMRHPDAAVAAALAERVGDRSRALSQTRIAPESLTPGSPLLQGWELWQQEMPELLRRTAETVDATLRSPHGFTALQAACLFGESTLIESLVERGADVNARPEDREHMGLVGEPPLALLARNATLPAKELNRLTRLLQSYGATSLESSSQK